MNDEEFLQQLGEAFAIEADEHLQEIASGLLKLEAGPDGTALKEIVESVFRRAHSLKGAARAVNRHDIESVCQALESIFAEWKRQWAPVRVETFDVLNRALDLIGKRLRLADVPQTPVANSEVIETVKHLGELGRRSKVEAPDRQASAAPVVPIHAPLAPTETAPDAAPSHDAEGLTLSDTVRIPMAKMDALLRRAEEMVALRLSASRHAAELREIGQSLETWRTEWAKVHGPGRGKDEKGAVDFAAWNQSFMRALNKRWGVLAKTAARDERFAGTLIDDLLEEAKRLVVLPFTTLLDLFPKQVRELARAQSKDIELIIEGREVEIDKRILEELKDPLIHLIRNAIDHGIETPEVRLRAGKPARGRLNLVVRQTDGSKVEILMADDGRGIDAVRVRESAVKNGVLGAEEAAALGDAAALQLIFHSGISTSPIVTEISGRGLGMAIVREKVEKLGGQVLIETQPGLGTSFRMLLPVTLATFKGILVTVSEQTFVLPTLSVERIARVRKGLIRSVENRQAIELQGEAMALAHLADVLELPRRDRADSEDAIEVVVIGRAEGRIAFVVDEVLHEQEILVKKLGKPLSRVRNVAGATILGSGIPAIILNVGDLLKSAVSAAATGSTSASPAQPKASAARPWRILVTDDSVTSRMLLKNILESAGYEVATAIDGVEALTALRSQEFDLAVSDVEMPRMDGFELTEKIRADKRLADLPVVLVTALGSREHQERGIDVGANAYIIKSSFDQSDLLSVVRSLV